MNRYTLVGCLLLSSALSCGNKSGDLDVIPTPQIKASDDPSVMAHIDEQVQNLTVDDERLYWLGSASSPYEYPPDEGLAALRSCQKDDCVGSLVTYARIGADQYTIQDGLIYWVKVDAGDDPRLHLLTCPTAGCSGEPTEVMSMGSNVYVVSLTAGALYTGILETATSAGFTEQVYRWKLPLDGSQAEKVLFVGTAIGATVISGDYAYWLEAGDSAALRRAPLDGSNEVETLADELTVVSSPFLAGTADYVYWSQGDLDGSIARCPLTGCTELNVPEVVAGPIRSPEALLVDGAHLYWKNDTNTLGYALSGCALADCLLSQPLTYGLEDGQGVLAVDAKYIYTVTTSQKQHQESSGTYGVLNPSADIRRIAK